MRTKTNYLIFMTIIKKRRKKTVKKTLYCVIVNGIRDRYSFSMVHCRNFSTLFTVYVNCMISN